MKNSKHISENIRKSFKDFFKNQNHIEVPSSSLIPKDDPTLLFTNSGMVQFKNYFTGQESPDNNNIISIQKCLRAGGKHNDLENVGKTPRHHTFFEMLGNFSFGEYFKNEAIEMAWNFLIKELNIDKKKLIITHHKEDIDSQKIWKKISGFLTIKLFQLKVMTIFGQWVIQVHADHAVKFFLTMEINLQEAFRERKIKMEIVMLKYGI